MTEQSLWAGAHNTGVRGDTAGLPLSTKNRFSTPGQVVEGQRFEGVVYVKAPGIKFVDCLFQRGEANRGRLVSAEGRDLVLEYCEIDGQGSDGSEYRVGKGIAQGNYTLSHVNIHDCNDGLGAGSSVLIEDSWIHDSSREGDLHPDAIQSTGGVGVTIRRSTLDCRSKDRRDMGNACIQLGNENVKRYPDSRLDDWLVEDCFLDGGNYAVNVRQDPQTGANLLLRRVTFGGNHRYGPIISGPHLRSEDCVMLTTAPAPHKRWPSK